MTRLSRFGLVAVLAVFAAPAAHAVDADPLLPTDADTAIYINVKQITESDVVKKYALEQVKQMLAGEDTKKMLESMGLDPLKDIEKIWIGSSGKTKDDTKGLVIFRGQFDPNKLLKAAEVASKRDGDKFELLKDKDDGFTLFKYQPDEDNTLNKVFGGNPVYGTVVDESTVILGTDKKVLGTARKQAFAKKPAPINADLNALVKKMDGKASFFAASLVKDKLGNAKLPATGLIDLTGIEKSLPNTDSISLALKISGDINLEVVFGMKDDDSATEMGDGVKKALDGVKGLVPLAAAGNPKYKPLNDVVKTIKTDVKDKEVKVTGKMTSNDIGKMLNPDDE